ncbi:hypothetical protein [Pseudorhodoferax sp. Leaf267]|uniref:hypothetical protein n=1 Tax=Pseudorhodoferax sp. Leaf267 TaxID=1736316 RepID=UPI000700B30F|nr:hypothetical protein [Pseudorhodoferax sp. Leaf267]
MRMADGSTVETTCRRIRAEIDGQPFWFAVHEVQGRVAKTISHFASGIRVCDLPYEAAFAMHARRDERVIALEALAHLAKQVGPDRMRQKLSEAERKYSPDALAHPVQQPQG